MSDRFAAQLMDRLQDAVSVLRELTAPAYANRLRPKDGTAVYCVRCDSTYDETEAHDLGACPFCGSEAEQVAMKTVIDRANEVIGEAEKLLGGR